jgi:hypothetical protein
MGIDSSYLTGTAGDLFATEKMRGRGQVFIIRALIHAPPPVDYAPYRKDDPEQSDQQIWRRKMLEKQSRRRANRK